MIIQSENFIQNPIVSVVIITYNQEQYIRQCIDSILNQETEYPYEIIIGEDCGIDATREICIEYQQKYPERIMLLLQDSNQGLLRNYRDVLNLCRGKYIAQCAGDDYWHNNQKIQLQINFLENNNDYGIVHSDYDILYTNSGKTHKSVNTRFNKKIPIGYVMKELYSQYHIVAPTVCFLKKIFFENVPYNEFLKKSFEMEDLPTFIIMSKFTQTGYINQSTATYRKGHFSVSVQSSIEKTEKFYNSLIEVMKFIFELYPNDVEFNHTNLVIYKNKALFSNSYKFGSYEFAKKYAHILSDFGVTDKKIFFCKNYLLFKLFLLFRKFKNRV